MKGKMKVATGESKKVNRKRQIESEKSNGKKVLFQRSLLLLKIRMH